MCNDEHFKALARHVTAHRTVAGRAFWWLRESLRGLWARCRTRRAPVEPCQCDVLLVHPSEKSRRLGRKAALVDALHRAGLNVQETVAGNDRQALRRRHLRPPPRPVPAPLYLSAARAADLLARYHPRVIITERNGWPGSTFLRAFRPPHVRILHVAHGILSDQSSKLRFHDFDYYAVFGSSSLEYLRHGEPGFGATEVLFAGPYFPLPRPQTPNNSSKTLLFLGAGPDEENSEAYRHSCELARQWLAAHPDWTLRVRSHPRGSGQPWRDLAIKNGSVQIRPDGETLDQALTEVAAVWSGYTTAIIDCAVAGVPIMVLGRQQDYFLCDRHGLPRPDTIAELDAAMEELQAEPQRWEEKLSRFARFHIAHWERPLTSLTRIIEGLSRGVPPKQTHSLP